MIFLEREQNRGTQVVHKFDNGYGASVIRHIGSYGYEQGLYELAVIKFISEDDWRLWYDTYITDDVLGYLTVEQVNENLEKIKMLEV